MIDRVLKFSLIIASGAFMVFAVVVIMASMTLSASADSVLVVDKFDDSKISGVIKDKSHDELTLVVNGKDVEVDTTGMELDPVEDLLKPGAIVKVEGEFKNDKFDARRLTLSDDRVIEDKVKGGVVLETSTDKDHDISDHNNHLGN